MSDMDEGLKEELIRTAAALIAMRTWRDRKITLKKISSYAKRLGLTIEELIDELDKRFEAVGLKLRIIKRNPQTSDSEAELFVVVDPRLKISAGTLDRLTSAVLAMIYVRAGGQSVAIESIFETLKRILEDEEKAAKILSRTLIRLERHKLIRIDREKKLIKLTSKALAILPEKKDLELMLIDLLD